VGRYALNVIGYSIRSRPKSHHHLQGKDFVLTNARWLSWLSIGLVGGFIITSKLRGYADIVVSLKWFPLHLPIDLIAIISVWLRITKIDLGQKTTGIGKVVSQKSKAVIACMMAIRIGEGRYLREITTPAENAGVTKVGHWLPTISKNERIIPNYCLMLIMG